MPDTQPRLRFGLFEIDLAAGDVYREGRKLRLQEQPRQVLAALLERPGEVVTRDELRERLWTTDTFVDFDHSLNTAIKKVRQALGDSAENPRFIETIAKRGYRFIAPVSTEAPVLVVPSVIVEPEAHLPAIISAEPELRPVRHEPASSRLRRIAAVFLLALAAGGAWWAWASWGDRPGTGAAGTGSLQVAVLPLRSLGEPSADDEHLGVGIADAIITRLSAVRRLRLRSTIAVLPYAKGDPREAAAALGVDHVIVGTIQRAADSYRTSLQLVSAPDGSVVWARTYDVPRAGLLTLQDTVAEQVTAALRIELTSAERERLHRPYTNNTQAADLYLRGRALLVNYTEANMRGAIDSFERALAIDPEYALARAALATACAWFSVRYAYESDASSWGKRAEEEARRALGADAGLAEAHLAIASAAGTLYRGFDWNTLLAESAEALALDPTLDLGHVTRMRALYHLGRFEEARAEGRVARTLNPSPNVETERLEVAVELFAGEFAAAAERATALLQRTDAPAVRHYLGLARFYLGDSPGARDMLGSAMRGGKPDVRSQASLASIEAAAGLRDQARARAIAIERGPYMDHHVAYSLGATWAQLGDDAAFTWLRRAADTGFACLPWFARDPLLDPIRSDPRFRDLLAARPTASTR
jgi:DNA-binding winged helix-turn-helix (wHTH) protein/TolB-like protein